MAVKTFILLVLIFCAHASVAQTLKVLPPETGAYHGAYADFGPLETDVTVEKIQSFVETSGKGIAWAYFSNHWLEGVIEFPHASVEACKTAGVIPYIRMSPWSEMEANKKDKLISMQKIIDGEYDEALRRWAQAARDSGTAIMIEFGPEVNGDWFPWNGKWNGGGERKKYGDPNHPDGPERFRDAFRHVIDLFRSESAHNITWVLHVDVARSPHAEWNDMKYYYPGDDYIDWIGLSVFGAQLPSHEWKFFPQYFKTFWKQVEETTTTKPILVSEYGVIEKNSDSAAKAKWLKQALQSVSRGLFKQIKGMTYWNSPGWLKEGKASFKIDSSTESLEAYRTEIQQPFWLEKVQLTPAHP